MMHGKLPANTITASLDTFSGVRREKKINEKGTKARRVAWKLKTENPSSERNKTFRTKCPAK